MFRSFNPCTGSCHSFCITTNNLNIYFMLFLCDDQTPPFI
nr:MAG TPA: hypothetical protein [Caudoviricetes sp.]DAN14019.1 MAG TPA: hypothetical protein [Caudoviricetes sp.]